MNTIINRKLAFIKNNTYDELSLLNLIITKSISTKWFLINLLINLTFDFIVTCSVIVLSICHFVSRNKEVLLLAFICYLATQIYYFWTL